MTRNTSPLAHALRMGSLDDVRQLLESGVDPNACGDFHIASSDFESKIEALLKHGWEIDRCQLLHDAKHGLGKRVQFYLSKGADPNTADALGRTALHQFAQLGIGKSAIRALVAAGANDDAKDAQGDTPMDLAKRAKRRPALETLLQLKKEKS